MTLQAPEFGAETQTPTVNVGAADGNVLPHSSFNMEQLRLSPNYGADLNVKRVLNVVPCRKPHSQEWFMTSADPANQFDTYVLESKEDREVYLVDRSLWPSLAGELKPKGLILTVNRQNVAFIWPLRLPGEDGRLDAWSMSARDAAQRATKSWMRMSANMALGAYEVFEATGDLPPPKWPQESFAQLIQIAFKDHYIADPNHPLLRRLRGEA